MWLPFPIPPLGDRNPISPEEVAAEVLACAEAGAGMAHLHVRDARGNLTDSPEIFRRTLDLIRRNSDIVIQGSTGGTPKGGIGALSHEKRAGGLLDERVEVGSLNMGSVNMDVDDLYGAIHREGLPAHLRSDSNPEYCAKSLREWLVWFELRPRFVEPGSPWENGPG